MDSTTRDLNLFMYDFSRAIRTPTGRKRRLKNIPQRPRLPFITQSSNRVKEKNMITTSRTANVNAVC